MNNIRQKLRSRRGASITFALLLFLVCAVVGSVVLAAGMAAAGRMSQAAEMDQRYYSVTSAADLLAKELTGKEVNITRTKTETTTTKTTITTAEENPDENNDTIPNVSIVTNNTVSYNTVISDPSRTYNGGNVINLSTAADSTNQGNEITPYSYAVFLTECAIDLMYFPSEGTGSFTRQNANTNAAMKYQFKMKEDKPGSNFTLVHTVNGNKIENLTVYGSYTLKADGTLEIKLSSGNTTNHANDIYTLTLTLAPKITETENANTQTDVNNSESENTTTTTIETKKITTKTSRIQWEVESVTKGGA